MKGKTIEKLNIPEREGFLQKPYWLLKEQHNGKKLRKADVIVLSAIFSYGQMKRERARCEMSYSELADRYRLSLSSVARAIRTGKETGLITQNKERCKTSYTFNTPKGAKRGRIIVDNSLRFVTYTIEGEKDPRYLTNAQYEVLALIASYAKGKDLYETSVESMAKILNLSRTTVQDAVSLLLRAKLIYRPRRGINCHERSQFAVNARVLRAARKSFEKLVGTATPGKPKKTAEELKIEREDFYTRLREEDSRRIDVFERTLQADKRYVELKAEKNRLEISQARADVAGDQKGSAALGKKLRSVTEELRQQLALHGLSFKDLQPSFRCTKCNDTGFEITTGKLCDCYPPDKRRRL